MPNINKELKHSRSIVSHGYLRSDELWEIEATMKDIKTHDVLRDFDGSVVVQGDPFHDISVGIVINDAFVIQAINVSIDSHPFPNCGQAVPDFDCLVGTKIGPGWSSFLKQEFKGAIGCTHVLELLPVAATTAFQMTWQSLNEKYPEHGSKSIQALINSCHGWAENGPTVTKIKQEQPDLLT